MLNKHFKDGDAVSASVLKKLGLVHNIKNGIKILSDGELDKKLNFSGLKFSKSAREKVEKAGGIVK